MQGRSVGAVVRKYSVGALNSLKMRDRQVPPPMGEIPPSRHDPPLNSDGSRVALHATPL